MQKEKANMQVRLYPSSHKKIKILSAERGDDTLADTIDYLINRGKTSA